MHENGIEFPDAFPVLSDSSRWTALLDRLDSDALTDLFIERIQLVDGYDPPRIPLAEIRRTGRLSFDALIHGLRSSEDRPDERIQVATDVGVSRARAGVPVESLMTAVRLDFSILWSALLDLAAEEDSALLVRHTARVWHTVDNYARQTQVAHAEESQRIHNEQYSVRQGLVAVLFQDPEPTEELLRHVARDLGLDPEAPLVVVAAVDGGIAELRVLLASAARSGATTFTHHLGNALIAFWAEEHREGLPLAELTAQAAGLRLGLVARRQGLLSLRADAGSAVELAHLLGPEETLALTPARGWARLARRRLSESGFVVGTEITAALATCTETERTRLLEAIRSYLKTGNVNASAAELFCHRNTVTNRLHRFEELTGIDVTVPEQSARLVVGWA